MKIKEDKAPFNQFRQKQEQEEIKKKYDIADTNKIVVVEKNNNFKFVVNLLINIGKALLYIVIVFFAFVGVVSLILPSCRNEIFFQIDNIWKQFLSFTGLI